MKKLLFLTVLFLCSLHASAQVYIGLNGKMSLFNYRYYRPSYLYGGYYVKNLKNLPSISFNVKKIISHPFFLDAELETKRMKFKHFNSDHTPPVWHRTTLKYTNDVLNIYIRPGYVLYHNKWFNVYGKAGLLCSVLIKSTYYKFSEGVRWDPYEYIKEFEYEREGSTYKEFSNIYLGGSLSVGIKTKLYKNFYIKTEGDYIYGFSNLINSQNESSITPYKKVNYSMYGGTIGLEYEF